MKPLSRKKREFLVELATHADGWHWVDMPHGKVTMGTYLTREGLCKWSDGPDKNGRYRSMHRKLSITPAGLAAIGRDVK